jgi:hypothetical protein
MITANVAQSAEEANMQARGIDPLRPRDQEDTDADLVATESPSSQRREGGSRAE